MIKNSNKNHYLALSLMVLFSFSVTILIFSPVSFVNIARALNPTDYNKSTGDSLGVVDWNRLDSDFVAKSGDTMAGSLTLPSDPASNMQAATKQYVDNSVSVESVITDSSANTLNMYCGKMPISLTNTTNPFNYTLRITVDTSSAGYGVGTLPVYISSLEGLGNHYRVTGVNTIYAPNNHSYVIYLEFYNNQDPSFLISVADAINWGWTVNWCAIAQ